MYHIFLYGFKRSRENHSNGRHLKSLISKEAAKFTEKILDYEQEDQILHTPFMIKLLSGMMIGIPPPPIIWGRKSHKICVCSPWYSILQYLALCLYRVDVQ